MGKKKLSFKEIMTNYGVIIIMVCLIVFTGITRPNFLTTNNLTNILATMSFRLVIALGIAGCIITAGCDLSAGRMIGFGGCIAGTLLQRADFFDRDWNLWVIIGILVFYLSLSRANPGINMSVREYGVYQAFSVPFFILIGITGSMLCIWVGKAFQNCIVGTVLAYIGQNTIVLLALHILGLEIFEMAAVKFINIGELTGAAFVLYHTVRVTASVCGCLLFGKILDGIRRALHGKHRG